LTPSLAKLQVPWKHKRWTVLRLCGMRNRIQLCFITQSLELTTHLLPLSSTQHLSRSPFIQNIFVTMVDLCTGLFAITLIPSQNHFPPALGCRCKKMMSKSKGPSRIYPYLSPTSVLRPISSALRRILSPQRIPIPSFLMMGQLLNFFLKISSILSFLPSTHLPLSPTPSMDFHTFCRMVRSHVRSQRIISQGIHALLTRCRLPIRGQTQPSVNEN
jgi:hypothetical protein